MGEVVWVVVVVGVVSLEVVVGVVVVFFSGVSVDVAEVVSVVVVVDVETVVVVLEEPPPPLFSSVVVVVAFDSTAKDLGLLIPMGSYSSLGVFDEF